MSQDPSTLPPARSAGNPKPFRVLDGGPAAVPPGLFGCDLPHSEEAEEHVLSCCLLDGAETLALCERLGITPAAFFNSANQKIFTALLWLRKRGLPIAIEVLAEELKAKDKLDEIGGIPHLLDISGKAPTTAQATYFAERVVHLHFLRRMITKAGGIVERAFSPADNVGQFFEEADTEFRRLLDDWRELQHSDLTAEQARAADLEKSRRAAAGDVDQSRWLMSGFKDLDQKCGPIDVLNNHYLVLVAGENGVGKSAYLRQLCGTWSRRGKAGMVFSLEMGARVWLELLAAQLARVNRPGRMGRLPADLEARYLVALEEAYGFLGKTLWVDDEPVTMEQMLARANEHLRRGRPLDYLVVDILSETKSSYAQQQRMLPAQEIEHVARSFKHWSKRHSIPVFLLAHFNREASKALRRPTKSDLRGTGMLENMADVIQYLWRPGKLPNGDEQDSSSATQIVEIGVLKNKVDRLDFSFMTFDGPKTLFSELSAGEIARITASPTAPGGKTGKQDWRTGVQAPR